MMRRRHLLGGSAGAALAAIAGCAATAPARPRIVLVHGAWHGGWCWDEVASTLRNSGCLVTAPTLPGMAERDGELSVSIDLDAHVSSVVDASLALGAPVTLVGHSYGGFVVTGAADRLAASHMLAGLVYLDAFVPSNGQRVSDYMPPEARARLQASFAAGNPAYAKPPARFFGITDPGQLAYVEARLTDQPAGTYLQPLKISGAWPPEIPRAYIACNQPRIPVFDDIKRRVAADPAWTYVELQTAHDAMVTAPGPLADTILKLVQPVRRT